MKKANRKATNNPSKSLVEKLVFLRYTLEEASNYLRDTTNEYGFTIGISLLHDSIENLFWAIALKKNFPLKDNSIPDKYEKLIKAVGKKLSFDKTSLSNLCRIRDSYKHHALLPNIPQTISIIDKIIVDFYQTISDIFGTDLNTISLSTLIMDKKLKKNIEEVEVKLYGNKKHTHNTYREILLRIGEIYFDYFEKNYTLSSLADMFDRLSNPNKKGARYKFPKKNVNEIALNHLELGLTPYFYWRFKNFIPEFGIDTKTNKTIFKTSVYWGRENWTELNVKFCLDWLINYSLKKQWLYSNKQYSLNQTRRVQVLIPQKDIKIQLSNFDTEKNIRKISEFNLKSGTEYLGVYLDFSDGTWQDYDEEDKNTNNFILYTSGLNYHGEIDKNYFNITETYIDDISQDKMNIYLSNASNSRKEISEEIVNRHYL
ncbi:MAG: hypothetical protein A3B47_04840 [Candidatus Levybacteria bacterium RIFCSPLOWO2_01_FULL_39_24]|nr:MAG: hypothetical protein A2800_04210 [Candidatus Levybacteria bacterium RIFCSPHIGHO2_01_FULL_40_16]OGH27961.1 MAG: hypothetical protein A3E12_02595 [Candidatus Levybacteria bacterium RIFCSPHIGHO2_12_FULL_39_9]OGH46769.1 MAG: hypothetical protein A3B47_04840 [Candidatus Levybacteria bacterium RIFCSPLOWO2_01_FULL_39_24]